MKSSVEYASFGARFSAYIIDIVILVILSSLIGLAFGIVAGILRLSEETSSSLQSLLGLAIGWLYYAYQESSPKQATIGKQAMNIAVTDLNGNRISFARATGRFFAKMLSGLILMIGYIMAAFTEKKQALHDIIAGTLVVSTKR